MPAPLNEIEKQLAERKIADANREHAQAIAEHLGRLRANGVSREVAALIINSIVLATNIRDMRVGSVDVLRISDTPPLIVEGA